MSYQVLARKWRPRRFEDMVGQGHVLRALVNALDSDRLHHAYLFAGTRGVGKTTVARIFAKALNCEQGVSSSPCGQCGACRGVDEGRFVDLVEVDAASRTGVDDTRELLENVAYAPAAGRFKVYLIDEVHMFSKSSFNALLKTLEEPPAHVKFLLATTEQHKLPVTILSRCLQFNLKRIPTEQIAARIAHILEAEGIESTAEARRLVGEAAEGSLRDGLSLLDQALAFSGGRLDEAQLRDMLGTIDRGQVVELLARVVDGDGRGLLEQLRALAAVGTDAVELLKALQQQLQRMAVLQLVPELADAELDSPALCELAARTPPEECQLHYQIALVARRDLDLAPEPFGALEMALLRMLAFRPAGTPATAPAAPQPARGSDAARAALRGAGGRAAPDTATGSPDAAGAAPPRGRAAPAELGQTGGASPPPVPDEPPPWVLDDTSAPPGAAGVAEATPGAGAPARVEASPAGGRPNGRRRSPAAAVASALNASGTKSAGPAESGSRSRAGATSNSGAGPAAGAGSGPGAGFASESGLESESEPGAGAESRSESGSGTKSRLRSGTGSSAGPGAGSEAGFDFRAGATSSSGAGSAAGAGTGPGTGFASESGPESESASGAGAESRSESRSGTKSRLRSGTGPRRQSESVSATEAGSGPRSGPASASGSEAAGQPVARGAAMADAGAGTEWAALIERLPLQGLARELASHCVLRALDGQRMQLSLHPDFENLRSAGVESRLRQAVQRHFGPEFRLELNVERPERETPAAMHARELRAREAAAQEAIAGDSFVQALQKRFDARVEATSPADPA